MTARATPLDETARAARTEWLKAQRTLVASQFAPPLGEAHDDTRDAIGRTHRLCLGQFVGALPANASVLDAACGVGTYWAILLAAGCEVLGVDASAAMLRHAHSRFPDVPTQRASLQLLPFDGMFDGAICLDSLDLLPPEDWAGALAGLRRAVRPEGHVYVTVALLSRAETDAAYRFGIEQGAPIVHGEDIRNSGYRFHPTPRAARSLIEDAGFRSDEELQGDGYAHFLLRRH